MPDPLRLINPGLAANAETYLIDAPLCTVVGCMHCGGAKQVVQHVGTDWMMQQIQINEEYYRKHLPPCMCNYDHARVRSLLHEIDALRDTNLALVQAKLEMERRIEQV